MRFTITDKQKLELYKRTVHDEIKHLIERKEQRLDILKSNYPRDLETIGKIEHGVMTLLELEHNLHLCDCPPEAYTKKGTL